MPFLLCLWGSRSLGCRRGVKADSGGGGEVEALRTAVDGDTDGVVESGAHLVGEAVGFAAEDPGDRHGQGGGVEFVNGVPVRADQIKAGRAARRERRANVTRSSDRQVEEAAGGGADALAVVRGDG